MRGVRFLPVLGLVRYAAARGTCPSCEEILTGTACDADGAMATWTETVEENSDGVWVRSISASGCPNHYSYCTGKKADAECGGYQKEGSDTQAYEQGHEQGREQGIQTVRGAGVAAQCAAECNPGPGRAREHLTQARGCKESACSTAITTPSPCTEW